MRLFNKKFNFILIISTVLLIIYLYNIRAYDSILESECSCKKHEHIQVNIKDNYYHVYMNNKFKYSFNINLNLTCNFYSSLRRGMNQKIIAYSLYGQNRFYYQYLTNITKLVKTLYPGWIIRIYHDNTIKCEIQCELNDDIVDFCNVEKLPNRTVNYIHKMMWRWLPIGDSFVDVFNSRDSDSLILQREVDSVQYWLESNKTAHIMRGMYNIIIKIYINNCELNLLY
jgi:hypothetical protein